MRKITLFIALLLSVGCFGQDSGKPLPAGVMRIDSSNIITVEDIQPVYRMNDVRQPVQYNTKTNKLEWYNAEIGKWVPVGLLVAPRIKQ